MANVLFTNVRVIDATGAQPYQGELLVQWVTRLAATPTVVPKRPHRGRARTRQRRGRQQRDSRPLRYSHCKPPWSVVWAR